MSTIVYYVLADGTKGSYQAPTGDGKEAIRMTRDELVYEGERNFKFKKLQRVGA
jgi:hypothetical protein